jgi:hypothetical protein
MTSATLTPSPYTDLPRPMADPYQKLNASLAALQLNPANLTAVLAACREYVTLGMIGPARELLSGGDDPLIRNEMARSLHDQISMLPSGRVAWAAMQRRFESNLQKLLAARQELRVHEADFRDSRKRLEVYQSRDGNRHLARRGDDGRLIWKQLLINATLVVEQTAIPHPPDALICPPYVVCHDRFCMLLAKLHAATRKMFLTFSPRLYLLTPDTDDLAATLYLSDDIAHLCDERVEILIGENCAEQLGGLLRDQLLRPIPEKLLCLPTSHSIQDRVLDQLRTVVRERTDQRNDDIQANQCAFDSTEFANWARRFDGSGAEPLRILGITSRFTTVLQYSMRDLAAAFERKGHSFQTLIDASDHDVLPHAQIAKTIREWRPDLVFSIDHLRSEFGQLIPPKLPYVCWIQDLLPHLMTVKAGRSLGPHDFFITPTLNEFVQTYEYPAQRGMIWTMATNAALYDSAPLPASELEPFVCDFSYISNQSTPPDVFHAGYLRNFSASSGRQLCEHLFQKLTREFASQAAVPRSAIKIITEAREETGIAPADAEAADRLARNYIHPLTELLFRQSTLRWVADYCETRNLKLDLYGRGWETHPSFAKYARGEARNGQMLRAIYQATRINLQINGYGAIHQRLLDGLASGGFFMIRDCPFDRIHTPAQKLREQVRLHGLHAGSHDAKHYPELAVAWRQANLCYATDVGDSGEIQLTQSELDRYQELEASAFSRVGGAVFAGYDQIVFATASEFRDEANHFLADAAMRRHFAQPMRDEVLRRFTYDDLIDALLRFMADSFRATP